VVPAVVVFCISGLCLLVLLLGRFGYWCCICSGVGGVLCYEWSFWVFENVWLVGAFSVFGRADTGNPVQIWEVFRNFASFLEFKGLI